MRISNFTTIRPEMASNRTAEDFMKFLGANPARLGIVASLYDEYTASHLTEALMNVFALDENRGDKFQSVDKFLVEWDIHVNQIKRIPFLAVPVGDGSNGSDIIVHFPEAYYQKNDTIIIENSRQHLFVMQKPMRRHDNDWEYVCKINDDDYSSILDVTACQPGMMTRFLTNYMPEMHEEGNVLLSLNILNCWKLLYSI